MLHWRATRKKRKHSPNRFLILAAMRITVVVFSLTKTILNGITKIYLTILPHLQTLKKTQNLNEPSALHELRRSLRDIKKHLAPGADRISYEMLQKLPKCSVKAVLKLFNQIWINNDFRFRPTGVTQ